MVRTSSVPSSSISYHLAFLTAKVDDVAERAGVLGSVRSDLESCLAALPQRDRRHVALVLESVRVHADSPALQDAVRLMLALAKQIWAEEPPPDASPERLAS